MGKNYENYSYGTESEIKNKIIYLTRKNQANKLHNLIWDDYQKNKLEACQWFHELCKNNIDIIYQYAYNPVGIYIYKYKGFGFNNGETLKYKYITINTNYKVKDILFRIKNLEECQCLNNFDEYISPMFFKSNEDLTTYPHTYSCTSIDINFKDIQHIKEFFNITDNNIPYYLQNWTLEPPYRGNSLLDLIDPVDKIDSPYFKLKFNIRLVFITKLYNKKIKELKKIK